MTHHTYHQPGRSTPPSTSNDAHTASGQQQPWASPSGRASPRQHTHYHETYIAPGHSRNSSYGGSPGLPSSHLSPHMPAYVESTPSHVAYTHQRSESRGRTVEVIGFPSPGFPSPGIPSPGIPSPGFVSRPDSRQGSRPSSKGPSGHRKILSGFQPEKRASSQERALLDLAKLNLHGSQTHLPVQPIQVNVAYQPPVYHPAAQGPTVVRHDAACNGCGADPLRGVRWHCTRCADEDICDGCKHGGVKRSHPFAPMEVGIENHGPVKCDGCGQDQQRLYGPRYECQRHRDEDWCDNCVRNSRACGGPYDIYASTDLGKQIEQYGCVPMPADWVPLLQPPTGAGYNVERQDSSATNWLSAADSLYWYATSQRDRIWEAHEDPVFKMNITKKKGHFISDHEFDWVMKFFTEKQKVFSYAHAQDRHNGKLKHQTLVDGLHGKRVKLDWAHGPAYDQLTFSTADHRQFRWITNKPVSAVFPERWDTQRYALFEKTAAGDVIVADFAWWDGHHDAPEDLLTIRSPTLDHALAIATLTIVFDHQWAIMMQENDDNEQGVSKTTQMARLTPLGNIVYFTEEDNATNGGKSQAKSGSRFNYRKVRGTMEATNLALEFTNHALEAAHHA